MSARQERRTERHPFMGRGGPWANFMTTPVRAQNTKATLGRLWGYLARHRSSLSVTALMVALGALPSLAGPYLLARGVDLIAARAGLAPLLRICGAMAAVYGAGALLTWGQAYVMAGVAHRTARDIRRDLFARIQRLPLAFFDKTPPGDTMSRVTNDVDNVNMVLSDSVAQITGGVLGMVGVVTAMLILNVRLALVVVLVTGGMASVMSGWVAKRTRAGFRDQQAALGELNGYVEETVSGQRVVIAYDRQEAAIERFAELNGTLRKASTRAQIFAGLIGPSMNLGGNLSLAIVATAGGVMAARGLTTVGVVAGFISYARNLMRPVNEIAALYNTIQAAMAGAERIFDVMDQPPETEDTDAKPMAEVRGRVDFEGVGFSYDKETPVLSDVDIEARPGEVVALIGPTGAGKTTVINLLSRFYDVDTGAIKVDGADIRRLPLEDLRRRLGIVLQDTFLFAGTVRENIRYGRLDATDEEIVEAARLANADQFIHRLPHGYDTELSERAANLSQGQRQLLAIARAMLADHSILILDEATSSVDTRTERHIQEAMRRLMAGRTCFIIAHRLSTIRDADQILAVNGGRIVERGTHQELLARKGFYWNLYTGQYRRASGAQVATSD